MPKPISCDPKTFNYALLKNDISKFTKKEGYSMEYISKNKLLRSKGYLSMALTKKALPTALVGPLCEFIGTNASKYKIEPEKPKVEPPVPKQLSDPNQTVSLQQRVEEYYINNSDMKPCVNPNPSSLIEPTSGWECKIRVDEDFETVMMKVSKNGEEMAISRCYFFSKDDMGIMQAISYAAHQCYKTYQQKVLAQQEADAALRTEVKAAVEVKKDPNDVRAFKNWVLKFKNDASAVGKLARYCESMYDRVPSHGERKIRMFLQLDKSGYAHVAAFNAIWPLYLKEYNAAEQECNSRIVNLC